MSFALIVLAKANMISSQLEQPWLTPETQAAFPDFVRRGQGLAVIHAGTSRYEKLPEMNALDRRRVRAASRSVRGDD